MCPQKLNSDNEVLAVKISAEYGDLNEYVYIVFFIDKYNNNIVDIAFIISNDYKMLDFLNAYTDLVELYKHIKIYNKLNESNDSSYYDKFNDVILNILSEDKNINNIIIYSDNNNKISIIDIFERSINKFMDFHIGAFDTDTKIVDINIINSAIEDINKEIENTKSVNMEYGDRDIQYEEGSLDSQENHAPAYKLINASFVVDPISGKSINDIVPGDKVIVSINSDTVEENIIYLKLNGKKDKYSKYLVPAEVLEKHVEDKLIRILLKFIEGYCCLIEEIEPIKLKLFNTANNDISADSEVKKDNPKKPLFENVFSKINTFKLIMFGLGAIIVFLFIAIIYVFFIQV